VNLLDSVRFILLKQPLEERANMAKGDKPDYDVKLPVEGVWHRLGAAWNNEGKDSITLVLDVGAALTFQPGTKLVLTKPFEKEAGE
jgi:hypothetical protein